MTEIFFEIICVDFQVIGDQEKFEELTDYFVKKNLLLNTISVFLKGENIHILIDFEGNDLFKFVMDKTAELAELGVYMPKIALKYSISYM